MFSHNLLTLGLATLWHLNCSNFAKIPIQKGPQMTKIVKEPFPPTRRRMDKDKFWVGWWREFLAIISLVSLKGQS